jgi:hypothetical protein
VRFPPFFDLFKLTMTCPSLGHDLVIYLMTITERAVQIFFIFKLEAVRNILIVSNMITITQTAHLTLSLLINIFATSIIALKAWCVHSTVFSENISLTCALMMMRRARTYRKHRKLLMEGGIDIRTPRQALRILAILVESGMIYILIGVSSASA